MALNELFKNVFSDSSDEEAESEDDKRGAASGNVPDQETLQSPEGGSEQKQSTLAVSAHSLTPDEAGPRGIKEQAPKISGGVLFHLIQDAVDELKSQGNCEKAAALDTSMGIVLKMLQTAADIGRNEGKLDAGKIFSEEMRLLSEGTHSEMAAGLIRGVDTISTLMEKAYNMASSSRKRRTLEERRLECQRLKRMKLDQMMIKAKATAEAKREAEEQERRMRYPGGPENYDKMKAEMSKVMKRNEQFFVGRENPTERLRRQLAARAREAAAASMDVKEEDGNQEVPTRASADRHESAALDVELSPPSEPAPVNPEFFFNAEELMNESNDQECFSSAQRVLVKDDPEGANARELGFVQLGESFAEIRSNSQNNEFALQKHRELIDNRPQQGARAFRTAGPPGSKSPIVESGRSNAVEGSIPFLHRVQERSEAKFENTQPQSVASSGLVFKRTVNGCENSAPQADSSYQMFSVADSSSTLVGRTPFDLWLEKVNVSREQAQIHREVPIPASGMLFRRSFPIRQRRRHIADNGYTEPEEEKESENSSHCSDRDCRSSSDGSESSHQGILRTGRPKMRNSSKGNSKRVSFARPEDAEAVVYEQFEFLKYDHSGYDGPRTNWSDILIAKLSGAEYRKKFRSAVGCSWTRYINYEPNPVCKPPSIFLTHPVHHNRSSVASFSHSVRNIVFPSNDVARPYRKTAYSWVFVDSSFNRVNFEAFKLLRRGDCDNRFTETGVTYVPLPAVDPDVFKRELSTLVDDDACFPGKVVIAFGRDWALKRNGDPKLELEDMITSLARYLREAFVKWYEKTKAKRYASQCIVIDEENNGDLYNELFAYREMPHIILVDVPKAEVIDDERRIRAVNAAFRSIVTRFNSEPLFRELTYEFEKSAQRIQVHLIKWRELCSSQDANTYQEQMSILMDTLMKDWACFVEPKSWRSDEI